MIKNIRSLAICLSLVIAFSVTHYSQAAGSGSTAKIGVINTLVFGDEKAGLTKYVAAIKTLNSEFEATQRELNAMSQRLELIAKEIQDMRAKGVAGSVPFSQLAAQAKVDEAEFVERDLKRRQEDAKIKYEKRQRELLSPVSQEIGKGLQEFAKQRGFSFIFDIAKDETGFLVAIGDEKADITMNFIAFFNAKK